VKKSLAKSEPSTHGTKRTRHRSIRLTEDVSRRVWESEVSTDHFFNASWSPAGRAAWYDQRQLGVGGLVTGRALPI